MELHHPPIAKVLNQDHCGFSGHRTGVSFCSLGVVAGGDQHPFFKPIIGVGSCRDHHGISVSDIVRSRVHQSFAHAVRGRKKNLASSVYLGEGISEGDKRNGVNFI